LDGIGISTKQKTLGLKRLSLPSGRFFIAHILVGKWANQCYGICNKELIKRFPMANKVSKSLNYDRIRTTVNHDLGIEEAYDKKYGLTELNGNNYEELVSLNRKQRGKAKILTEQELHEKLEAFNCNKEMQQHSEVTLKIKFKASSEYIEQFLAKFNDNVKDAERLEETAFMRETLQFWEGRCENVFSPKVCNLV
jgi:hypothetical protein